MTAASSRRLRGAYGRPRPSTWVAAGALLLPSCLSPFEARHESMSDSRDQIWMSEESQVSLRAAQSRVFDTTDRIRLLSAIVATLQDLGFMIEVLDEELGIVSAKRFDPNEGQDWWNEPTYYVYDDDAPLFLTRTYSTWGPFYHRTNLVRATITIRRRGETQTVVRANAQFYLHAVEDPQPYQRFFETLQRVLFLEGHSLEDDSAAPAPTRASS